VLDQPGVASVIVLIGINDISWPGTAFARAQARPSLAELQSGYRDLAQRAHARGLRILGATLTPFAGALPDTPLDDYYAEDKDALRQQLNSCLRTDSPFDAVIDLHAALRDPADPSRMAAAYDSGDHLHPGDAGNRAMAEAVDLDVLIGPSTQGVDLPRR
jgi:lysophospholipase L1-like esterase